MILAIDIGGTKTSAALFANPGETTLWCPVQTARWPSQDFHFDLLRDFLKSAHMTQSIQAAGFSLAGPIVNNQCHLVNLNRTLDLSSVYQEFPQIGCFVFANDVVATAHSLTVLPTASVVSLTDKQPPFLLPENQETLTARYPIAVLSLGTGLGQSVLLSPESALSSEGAHGDFSPCTEQQVELWRFLRDRFDHVSYERLLSGPGLCNIYSFLALENPAAAPDLLTPTPSEITSRALSGTCPLCQSSLDLFIEILGAQAGNLALQAVSLGGVCLAGGIVPHILPALRQEKFYQAFLAKGRFRQLVQSIPIAAVCDDRAPLWGSARLAYLSLPKS